MKRMKQQSKQKQEVLCEHFLYLETHMNTGKIMQTFFYFFKLLNKTRVNSFIRIYRLIFCIILMHLSGNNYE